MGSAGKDPAWRTTKPVLATRQLNHGFEQHALILVIYSVLFFDNETSFPGYAALVPTVGAALITHDATSNSLVGSVLSNKILVGIGLISYSAYLWHQPIFAFTRHHASSNPSPLTFLVLAVFTLAISFFSWKYIEQPFRNKEIWSRKHIFLFSFAGLALFAAAGIIGWKTDGLCSITRKRIALYYGVLLVAMSTMMRETERVNEFGTLAVGI